MSYCITTIDGNLTANPKEVTIGDSTKAVEISIAVNYNVRGEKQTSFYRVLFFAGDDATYLLNTAKVGSRITVVTNTRTVKKDTTVYTNYTGISILQLFPPHNDGVGKPDNVADLSGAVLTDASPKSKVATPVETVDDDLPF